MNAVKGFLLSVALLCLALALSAQTPQWQWAVGAGGTFGDSGFSVAVDSQGNQYVTGFFRFTASFGPYTLTSIRYDDIFVAKLDPDGNWLWAVSAGGSWWDDGLGIAVDGVGNVFLTGFFGTTATFGSHILTSNGSDDIFAAKLDPDGNWLWAVGAGGSGSDRGQGIAVDSAGNACLTGEFRGTASFGDHTLNGSNLHDIFAAKLDPDGNWLWAVSAGAGGDDSGRSIAVDGSGNTFLTGIFEYIVSFGPHIIAASGDADIFAAKLDPSGNWLWAVSAGGTEVDEAYSIAVDGTGNAFLTGFFAYSASFGPHTITSSGDVDIFAAKLDTGGNWLWAAKAGGNYWDEARGIAVDGSGDAWLTGSFGGTAAFGPYLITSVEYVNTYAAKIDTVGNWLWALSAGETIWDEGYGIAVDGSGNAWLTGEFPDTAHFGDHTLIPIGDSDIFVAKLGSGTPVDEDLIPEAGALSCLYDAYPNPLRPGQTATITSNVAERETGILTVLNLRGQVLSSQALGPGSQQVSFASGNLPSGVYLYKLQTPSCSELKKLVLLK